MMPALVPIQDLLRSEAIENAQWISAADAVVGAVGLRVWVT